MTLSKDEEIRLEIRTKYAQAADSPENLFAYPTGRSGAEGLGYASELIAGAPSEVVGGFCGVGNPFAIAPIEPGVRVLDIGCGSGFDLYCTSRMVGSRGLVVGIDMTPEMASRAGRGLAKSSILNAQVLCGAAEELPLAPETFDIVISNGVLNLSPRKSKAFAEIFRVLRPNGRLQFADIILEKGLPEEKKSVQAWSE
jgi:arsenite methyltransferase